MSKADPVLVFGAGGHAKVVIDVLLSRGEWQPAAVFDDNVKVHGKEFHGSRVHGDRHALLAHARASGVSRFIVAVGNNGARAEVFRFLEAAGLQAVTAVHASAVVAPSARIGAGSVVMPGVCINADVAIGRRDHDEKRRSHLRRTGTPGGDERRRDYRQYSQLASLSVSSSWCRRPGPRTRFRARP